jgi:preprotein translocase subunit SecE
MLQRIKQFFREVRIELKKVVYPDREELIGSTWVVIISVLLVALFLGVVDWSLSELVKRLLRWM